MKKIFAVIFLMFLTIFAVSCGKKDKCLDKGGVYNEETKECITTVENQKINVVTSITPIASIANYIGGDEVEVKNIVPTGVSPHHFELTPENAVDIENSNLVFSIGLEHIDGFLEKGTKGKTEVKLAEGLPLMEAEEHEHDEDEEEHQENEEEHQEDDNHDKDPHIWLGEEYIKVISDRITKKLTELKPEKKSYFEENQKKFNEEIKNIFEDFRNKADGIVQKKFIVFHDAYNYLFNSGMIIPMNKFVFSENVSSEISAEHLKELIDQIRQNNIQIIFKEPQFNSKQIENLAKENNLQILELDPIGNDSSKDGFINNLKKNFDSLSNVLIK